MVEGEAPNLLVIVERYGRSLAAGKITPEELVNALVDKLVGAPGDNTAIAGEVVARLAPNARAALAVLVQEIRRGDFRWSGFAIGPKPMTEAEEQRLSALRTAGCKLWADVLARELVFDSPETQGTQQET